MTPIVFLEWIDAHNNTGWFDEEAMGKWAGEDWYCEDVGFLVRETSHMLIFAQRHEPDGHANGEVQWGGLHKIPKTWIRNRRLLGYLKQDGTFVPPRRSKMPFKSKAQARAAFGGYLGPEMKRKADQWAKETPNMKKLPKHVKAKKSKKR